MEQKTGPITLNFTDGKTVQISREFWTKNNLDRFDSVRAVKHGKRINFYGDYLSDEDKAKKTTEAVEAKTEFDVILTSYGPKKLEIVREVKNITSLGLKESMALVQELPAVLKEGISKEEAEMIKNVLTEKGAEVELK